MKAPVLAGWTVLALIATAFAQDKATLITQLRSAAEAELQAQESKRDPKEPEKPVAGDYGFKRAVSQLQLLAPDAPDAQLTQAIAAVHSTASNPATRKAAEALNAFLQKETEERKEKAHADVEATAKRAAEVGLNAKSSKELDAPISELTELMGAAARSYGIDGFRSITSAADTTRLQPLLAWIQNRQEFLLQMESGDRKAAKQTVQRHNGMSVNLSPWIPRSQLLAQQAADLKLLTPSPEALAKQTEEQIQNVMEISRQVLAAEDPGG